MSDRPREIDCHEVMERLYEYLDGELDARRKAEVRNHLEDCVRCFGLSRFETAYIAFLEARTRAKGAPATLKRKILDRVLLGDGHPDD